MTCRPRVTSLRALMVLALACAAAPASAQFTYSAAGTLERAGGGALRVGAGRVDSRVYAPGIRFPIENAPAYANSQIYGYGGYMGPGGGQCDARNYAYPWHDNYCEERSWDMPMCPSGRGHQGQDLRPATCVDQAHWAVATDAGTITHIGTYSVYLTADDGRRYDYLHMRGVAVSVGQRVSRGQRLGRVSNNMGSTPTSIHLHFNIRMNVSGYGSVYAPTYMSLIGSYQELIGPPPWSAAYVSQSFPLASHAFELAPGQDVAGHIEMRNIGGETWRPGQTFLGTTQPRDVASPIAHPSWVSPGRAATVDRIVAPGETGRFAFTVRGPSAPGDYPQFFNLVQEGVAWFSDSGVPRDDQLQIRVTVVPPPPCPAGVGPAWSCDGTARTRCVDGRVERESCAMICVDGACADAPPPDADGDGHDASADCDDSDLSVHPGASDACGDGVDQDCDGADAVCASEDASVPVVPELDAAIGRADAGVSPTPPREPEVRRLSGGCSCRVAARPSSGLPLLSLLGLAGLLRRRRR